VVGIWGELFYSFDTGLKKHILRFSAGADYSFLKYCYVAVEYFYDSSGEKDYRKYFKLLPLNRMTLGREYLMSNFTLIRSETTNYGITALINLSDGSTVIFPFLQYEFLENTTLGVGIYNFQGKKGREFSPENSGKFITDLFLNVRF